ncbi:hypothetical protein [Flagellimonas sediminis]|uniref:Uncharacterized protein n=1 Tax=Flagellimonas sediminis TaxID=2696468 RepID=A0A6I5KYL5_9FLAO|nr:hypothetical protein [Allomuricauda sediminis]NDV42050.1 hypothetical protein [Allomuricauda sediminis]
MKTKELPGTFTDQRTIRLVKGSFTASEATDVIFSLIEEKINFHKLQRLTQWEGNHSSESPQLNQRIDELEQEKETARRIVELARSKGKNVRINGILEMQLED